MARHLPGSSGAPPFPPPRRFLPNREGKICLVLYSCQEIFSCCSSPGAESGPAFTAAAGLVEMGMGFHWDLSRMGQHQSKSLWHSELSGVTLGQCPVPRNLRVTNWADPAAPRAGSCVPWALWGVGLLLCPLALACGRSQPPLSCTRGRAPNPSPIPGVAAVTGQPIPTPSTPRGHSASSSLEPASFPAGASREPPLFQLQTKPFPALPTRSAAACRQKPGRR